MKRGKKIACLAVAGIIALGAAGCASKPPTNESTEVVEPEENVE